MGKVFLENFGGSKVFTCKGCETFLTNREQLISNKFTGSTGKAYLFDKVVNLKKSEVQERQMLTGKHMVRDVFCKVCLKKLGWFYEYANDKTQAYKEGKVILERALINEKIGTILNTDNSIY